MNRPDDSHSMAREETIFNAAIELRDPAKRRAYLDLACENDAALRARMEKMIAAADDTFFDKTPASPSSAELETPAEAVPVKTESAPLGTAGESIGQRIDRYKLLEK